MLCHQSSFKVLDEFFLLSGIVGYRLGKFTSISGRQRTTKIQYLVVRKYLWSSSSVLLLQNSKKTGKIGIFLMIISQKSSSHVDDQNYISGRPQLFSGRH